MISAEKGTAVAGLNATNTWCSSWASEQGGNAPPSCGSSPMAQLGQREGWTPPTLDQPATLKSSPDPGGRSADVPAAAADAQCHGNPTIPAPSTITEAAMPIPSDCLGGQYVKRCYDASMAARDDATGQKRPDHVEG